jgi:hypothetical protein
LQVKPQLPLVQVAIALEGALGQGAHDVPHEAGLVSETHAPLQAW